MIICKWLQSVCKMIVCCESQYNTTRFLFLEENQYRSLDRTMEGLIGHAKLTLHETRCVNVGKIFKRIVIIVFLCFKYLSSY